MDVTQQVDSIVDGLVKQIETRLHARVDQLVNSALQEKLDLIDYDKKLNWLASAKLDTLISAIEIDHTHVQARLDAVSDQVVTGFADETKRMATEHVKHKLYNEIDVNHVVREIMVSEITKKLATFAFPRSSIPGSAIDSASLAMSGNNIKGGTIQEFGSTGIQDKSTQVQMTLLDQGVVIENKLISLGLEVRGQTVIEGDLHITGNVPMDGSFFQKIIDNTVAATKSELNADLFEGFTDTIFQRIRDQGLDLNKITLDGNEIVVGNKLSYTINDTNITRLGLVRDLQTTGDSLFGQTLYVGQKRVGINTLEPGHAFSVWDQEVEIGFSKRERDVAWIGTPREQSVVLSANRHDNVVLNKDGSVSVQKLFIGPMELGSSAGTPSDVAPKGAVRFNSDPKSGSAAGWVSLGGGAWSRFGTLG